MLGRKMLKNISVTVNIKSNIWIQSTVSRTYKMPHESKFHIPSPILSVKSYFFVFSYDTAACQMVSLISWIIGSADKASEYLPTSMS